MRRSTIPSPGKRAASHSPERPLFPWQTVNRALVALILATAAAGVAMKFIPEIRRCQALHAWIRDLQSEEEHLRLYHELLLRELDWMETRPEYVEQIARDKLDLYRPGELIFRPHP